MDAVFREGTAQDRTESVPLSHVSLELGHLAVEDFEGGTERLRQHFRRVRPWADTVRAAAAATGTGADATDAPGALGGSGTPGSAPPRISTCLLVDDYFGRLSAPAVLLPRLLAEAGKAGLTIDYLARESGCVEADGRLLAEGLLRRLVDAPPPFMLGAGEDGRPQARETGRLSNGRYPVAFEPRQAMSPVLRRHPPTETEAHRHSVFMDVELWDDGFRDGPPPSAEPAHAYRDTRVWSCSFLAAVWQLTRLGLLRDRGRGVVHPRPLGPEGPPQHWDELPPVVQLNPTAAPFAAYRTCSVLPVGLMPVEHAVRVILSQVDVDPDARRQVTERSAREGAPVPDVVADRASYVFYEGP
ncbi:SCO2522 family protein [Streptomyces sp. NBC_01198]|uniref:SCO2522 family protein n=1 Tax=Streptomyces sp. NBC_01198 TaxID=2903769 RepID=UPI002E15FC4D|nr:SCO2522 family protein [Streptomyces sp. NBC_01198]